MEIGNACRYTDGVGKLNFPTSPKYSIWNKKAKECLFVFVYTPLRAPLAACINASLNDSASCCDTPGKLPSAEIPPASPRYTTALEPAV